MKKYLFILICINIFLVGAVAYLCFNKDNLSNAYIQEQLLEESAISYMIFDENEGRYVKTATIPTGSDWGLDLSKSYCLSGGKITGYSSSTGTVTYLFDTADECYVYFNYKSVYGIKRSLASSSSAWERTDASIGMSATAKKGNNTYHSDFDFAYPWSDIKSYNINPQSGQITAWYGDSNFKFDGTNGEVMTYIPDFYIKRWQDGTNEYIQISSAMDDGFVKVDAFSVGRYDMSYDTKAHSISGALPKVSTNITTFRNYAQALGNGWGQMDWRYFALQDLYLVEYADYNSQTMLGSGITSMRYTATDLALKSESNTNRIIVSSSAASNYLDDQQIGIGTSQGGQQIASARTILRRENYDDGDVAGVAIYFDGGKVNITAGNMLYTNAQRNGGCDSLGMSSGTPSNDGKHCSIYRGIENIFGNVWQFIDGINIKDRRVYVNYDPMTYIVDKFDGDYSPLSYTNATSDGYAKTMGYDANHSLMAFTTSVGGSASTYMSDYYYQATGNRILLAGAYFSGGSSAGVFSLDGDSASSSAYIGIGSRLLKYQV